MIDENTPMYFSPEFISDFKKFTHKYDKFYDDMDNFLKALRTGNVRYIDRIGDLHDGCKGFKVSKVKKFRCAELGKGSRSGFRIIFSEHNGCVLFLELYHKSKQNDMDKKMVCGSLATVKDGSCRGQYRKLETPCCRSLVRK